MFAPQHVDGYQLVRYFFQGKRYPNAVCRERAPVAIENHIVPWRFGGEILERRVSPRRDDEPTHEISVN
jgi:hypothetical protein